MHEHQEVELSMLQFRLTYVHFVLLEVQLLTLLHQVQIG